MPPSAAQAATVQVPTPSGSPRVITAVQAAPVTPAQWVVAPGQTLSGIAAALHLPWTGLWAANEHIIPDPNEIYPGQHLIETTAPLTTAEQSALNPPVHVTAAVVHTAAPAAPPASAPAPGGYYDPAGPVLTWAQVGQLWLSAGGPAWAEEEAEEVSNCESSHDVDAYNLSGATGLWQILGSVVPGNLRDARVNALNAVSKFEASGDTWAQWVCKP